MSDQRSAKKDLRADRYWERAYDTSMRAAGFCVWRSDLFVKHTIGGSKLKFVFFIIECGPQKAHSKGGRYSKVRNYIKCVLFASKAAAFAEWYDVYMAEHGAQPWVHVAGKWESQYRWKDKEDHSKGKERTGETVLKVKTWATAPIMRSQYNAAGEEVETLATRTLIDLNMNLDDE